LFLTSSFNRENIMVAIRPDEISSIIRQQIEQYDQDVKVSNVGTVLQVGDGIARIYGLEQAMAGELLEFEDGTVGIALNLEEDDVGAVLMGQGLGIQEGSSVTSTGKVAEIPVGEAMIGRVVDALARPIDGKGDINTTETRLIESPRADYWRSANWQNGCCRRYHPQPEGRGCHLCLCGDRSKSLNGGSGCQRLAGAGRVRLHDRRRRQRQ
jgi:hypothetical protein